MESGAVVGYIGNVVADGLVAAAVAAVVVAVAAVVAEVAVAVVVVDVVQRTVAWRDASAVGIVCCWSYHV